MHPKLTSRLSFSLSKRGTRRGPEAKLYANCVFPDSLNVVSFNRDTTFHVNGGLIYNFARPPGKLNLFWVRPAKCLFRWLLMWSSSSAA